MTAPALDRLIFKTSRLAEFCSQRELINQTGPGVEDWPLVVLKEVVDNALDACEEADIAPVIEMRAIARRLRQGDFGDSICQSLGVNDPAFHSAASLNRSA